MFKITIEETRTKRKTVGGEWATIDQVPTEDGQSTKPKYGYTPEIEKTVTETIKVYEQVVDELDLAAVIKAVNGMEA